MLHISNSFLYKSHLTSAVLDPQSSMAAFKFNNRNIHSKHTIFLTFSLLASFVFSGLAVADDSNLLTLYDFERLYIDGRTTPPVDIETDWLPVTLKDIWTARRRALHTEAWYRTEFELPAVPEEQWGIYLPRVSATASVWLNSVEIGSVGDLTDPSSNMWNHPQLFELPKSFLKEGSNTLYIRLKTPETFLGILFEPTVGPYSDLDKIYQPAFFFKVTASKILSGIMLVGIIILSSLYFFIRLPSSYFWFITGSIFWTIYSLDLFVTAAPFYLPFLDWLLSFSLFASSCCYFAAVNRMLERTQKYRFKLFERIIIVLVIAEPLAKITLSPLHFSAVSFLYLTLSALIVFFISVTLIHKGIQRRREGGLWMLVSGSVILLVIAYDASMYAFQVTALFAKYPYIPLVSTISGVGIFFARVIAVTKENEGFKANVQTVDTAISTERERLQREIHDGVGGQLVSTLAILEKGNFRSEDIMDSVKTSLDDLRLILSSLEPASHEGDVLGILATVRERLEYRLLQAGIVLKWDVEDIPGVQDFDSEQALHLMRILQEAITNVVKHAQATEITVSCAVELRNNTSGIGIQISDNGVGSGGRDVDTNKNGVDSNKNIEEPKSGFGVKNMKLRAEFLHGELSVDNHRSGTTVHLWIPGDL